MEMATSTLLSKIQYCIPVCVIDYNMYYKNVYYYLIRSIIFDFYCFDF